MINYQTKIDIDLDELFYFADRDELIEAIEKHFRIKDLFCEWESTDERNELISHIGDL